MKSPKARRVGLQTRNLGALRCHLPQPPRPHEKETAWAKVPESGRRSKQDPIFSILGIYNIPLIPCRSCQLPRSCRELGSVYSFQMIHTCRIESQKRVQLFSPLRMSEDTGVQRGQATGLGQGQSGRKVQNWNAACHILHQRR